MGPKGKASQSAANLRRCHSKSPFQPLHESEQTGERSQELPTSVESGEKDRLLSMWPCADGSAISRGLFPLYSLPDGSLAFFYCQRSGFCIRQQIHCPVLRNSIVDAMTIEEEQHVARCLTLSDIFQKTIPTLMKDASQPEAPILRKQRELPGTLQAPSISIPAPRSPESLYLQHVNWKISNREHLPDHSSESLCTGNVVVVTQDEFIVKEEEIPTGQQALDLETSIFASRSKHSDSKCETTLYKVGLDPCLQGLL